MKNTYYIQAECNKNEILPFTVPIDGKGTRGKNQVFPQYFCVRDILLNIHITFKFRDSRAAGDNFRACFIDGIRETLSELIKKVHPELEPLLDPEFISECYETMDQVICFVNFNEFSVDGSEVTLHSFITFDQDYEELLEDLIFNAMLAYKRDMPQKEVKSVIVKKIKGEKEYLMPFFQSHNDRLYRLCEF